MATLLLRLVGPMQAWGDRSRFGTRDTSTEPTKSGIVGLLASALGRSRSAGISDLAALRMGVRVDRPGTRLKDYHTAGVGKFNGRNYGVARAYSYGLTQVAGDRFFLADAAFLVGLEGERELLDIIDSALRRPAHPLCLGRKAFAPSRPVRAALWTHRWPRRSLPRIGLPAANTRPPG